MSLTVLNFHHEAEDLVLQVTMSATKQIQAQDILYRYTKGTSCVRYPY